jgi:hypothetical protein
VIRCKNARVQYFSKWSIGSNFRSDMERENLCCAIFLKISLLDAFYLIADGIMLPHFENLLGAFHGHLKKSVALTQNLKNYIN